MIRHYVKIAFRALVKFRGFAAINLLGLSLGLATGILILTFVLDELSFDRFHTKADRIYRVTTDIVNTKSGGSTSQLEANGWPIGALLVKDFPEVEKLVYLANCSMQINHEGKRFEEKLYYAGPEFFDIFSFPMIKGDPATALVKAQSIVLTESAARKYFRDEEALGKTMTLADTLTFVVTGIMKDVPSQSHMQFNMLLSFSTYESVNSWFSYNDGWGNINVRNYVLLKEGADPANLFAKARTLYVDHVKDKLSEWGMDMFVSFEPLNDIYLKTHRGNGMGPIGSITKLYIVSGIAIFIILLASINYMNLATARSVYRAKEVGLRKTIGSSRGSLTLQFLGESLLLTIFSFVVSIFLVAALLPLFNQLLEKSYTMELFLNPVLIGALALLIALVTLLAGYYPAMVMSAIKPSEVLKGNFRTSGRGIQLRRVLVVFQFMISASLIICALVGVKQLTFMMDQDLGFRGDQVIVLDTDKVGKEGFEKDRSAFKNELRKLAAVQEVTFANAVPGRPGWVGQWAFPAERPEVGSIGVEYMAIDEDYLKTLQLKLVAGRNFDVSRPSDIEGSLIINEACVHDMGWGTAELAIGKVMDSPSKHPAGTVIGVVKDYHEFGLQRTIYPMAMDYNPSRARYFVVRYDATATTELLTVLEKLWKSHYDGHDFKYFFLDENFAKQYHSEQRLVNVFVLFSIVTVVIAVIGLIGLVSFMVVSRTKEIGIRKILGAGVLNITRLLSTEFLVLVVIANLIACPLTWYLTNKWLQGFAYRITLGPGLFVISFVIAVGITLIAISFQTIRAAQGDPVDSLRRE